MTGCAERPDAPSIEGLTQDHSETPRLWLLADPHWTWPWLWWAAQAGFRARGTGVYLIQDHPSHASIDNFPGPDIVDIGIACAEGVAVITVIGELDVSNTHRLYECLHDAIDEGVTDLVVDVEHLTFMDSTGVSVLEDVHKRICAAGGTLSVLSPLPNVQRLLAATYVVSSSDFGDVA